MSEIKCSGCLELKEEYYENSSLCKECAEEMDNYLEGED